MKRYKDIAGDGGSNIIAQVVEHQARLRERMATVRYTIAVVSGKGGVGKSSLSANLAVALARDGAPVGVLDGDINGPSIAKILGVRGHRLTITEAGVFPAVSAQGIRAMSMDLLLPSDETPVTWDAPTQSEAYTWRGTMEANTLREFLTDTIWGELDYLIIDLPPGTDRLPTLAGLLTDLTGSIIVTIPSEISTLVVKKSIAMAQETKSPILGLVENMAGYVCPHCGELGELFGGGETERMAADFGISFLGSIPFDPRLAHAADRGAPFVAEQSESLAARAIGQVAERLRATLTGASHRLSR